MKKRSHFFNIIPGFSGIFVLVLLMVTGVSLGQSRGYDVYPFFAHPYTDNVEMRDNLIALIDSATRKIDAHFYQVNDDTVVEAFCRAARRLPSGSVRFITDNHYRNDAKYRVFYEKLESAGVRLIDDTEGGNSGNYESHNKFAVLDDTWVWTGSYNITDSCLTRNNNNAMAINSREIAAEYTKEFEEMFVNKRFGSKKLNKVNHKFGNLEIYTSPKNDVQETMLQAINNAQDTICFAVFAFTDEEIKEAIIKKLRQGIKVFGLFDQLQGKSQYSAYHDLQAAGAFVSIDGNKGLLHHKLMIVDPGKSNQVLITGSKNWTAKAKKYNDENTVVLRGSTDYKDAIKAYLDEFRRCWEERKDSRSDERNEPDIDRILFELVEVYGSHEDALSAIDAIDQHMPGDSIITDIKALMEAPLE